MTTLRFSIITPSRGDRPRALARAVESVDAAVRAAAGRLTFDEVEMLVGFDGVKGERPQHAGFVKFYDFPPDKDFGNGIRHGLLKAAKGERVIFLDDDNVLTEQAFSIYMDHPEVEFLAGRVDTSNAFDKPYLPVVEPGRETVRQTNIDPLCLCLSRDLVVHRCAGWTKEGGYQADYVNMVKYYRRAGSVKFIEDTVGIYDASRGLDEAGLNFRQEKLKPVEG